MPRLVSSLFSLAVLGAAGIACASSEPFSIPEGIYFTGMLQSSEVSIYRAPLNLTDLKSLQWLGKTGLQPSSSQAGVEVFPPADDVVGFLPSPDTTQAVFRRNLSVPNGALDFIRPDRVIHTFKYDPRTKQMLATWLEAGPFRLVFGTFDPVMGTTQAISNVTDGGFSVYNSVAQAQFDPTNGIYYVLQSDDQTGVGIGAIDAATGSSKQFGTTDADTSLQSFVVDQDSGAAYAFLMSPRHVSRNSTEVYTFTLAPWGPDGADMTRACVAFRLTGVSFGTLQSIARVATAIPGYSAVAVQLIYMKDGMDVPVFSLPTRKTSLNEQCKRIGGVSLPGFLTAVSAYK